MANSSGPEFDQYGARCCSGVGTPEPLAEVEECREFIQRVGWADDNRLVAASLPQMRDMLEATAALLPEADMTVDLAGPEKCASSGRNTVGAEIVAAGQRVQRRSELRPAQYEHHVLEAHDLEVSLVLFGRRM